jgi:hypothetical protein
MHGFNEAFAAVIGIIANIISFLVGMDLNSGFWTCKAGALLLERYLQSILLWLVWRWGVSQTIWLGWS